MHKAFGFYIKISISAEKVQDLLTCGGDCKVPLITYKNTLYNCNMLTLIFLEQCKVATGFLFCLC